MWTRILAYASVAGLSALKVVPGAALSFAPGYDFTFIERFLCIWLGGSLGVVVFALFGDRLRGWINRLRKKDGYRPPAPAADWRARLWRKYGLWGAGLLTPPILSPPGGVALALAFGTPKRQIIAVYGACMAGWALVFALAGEAILAAL